MKKLTDLLMLLLIFGNLTCCQSESDPLEEGNHRGDEEKEQHVKKMVRMTFGGDYLSESEEPLLRADDGDKYIAINVFRTEKDKADASEEKYAYGLFKNQETVIIDVVTGFTYRFESTLLIEGEDKLFVNEDNYSKPFQINTQQNLTGSSTSYHEDDLNKFQYPSDSEDRKRYFLHQLQSGEAYVDTGDDDLSIGSVWYPRVKRYYGKDVSFDPGLTEGVEIEMEYKCFGLKFEVVELPAGTRISVEDITKLDAIRDKQPLQKLIFPKDLSLSNDQKVWEGTFSMNNIVSESESFKLLFTWHKGGNETEQFIANVTVRPKVRKVLKISISGTTNDETKGNIMFSGLDNVDLADEYQDVDNVDEES